MPFVKVINNNYEFSEISTLMSPYTTLIPVSLDSIRIHDNFWRPRLDLLVRITLLIQFMFIEETGRLNNFKVASDRKKGGSQDLWFNDSDVYKCVEAATYAMIYQFSDELWKMVDTAVREIVAAQKEDGYIITFITINRVERLKDFA